VIRKPKIKPNQLAEILSIVNSGKQARLKLHDLRYREPKAEYSADLRCLKRPQKVLSLKQHAGIGARKIAKSTGFPLGTVNAILT